jgi:hypothetical protein
MDIKVDDRFILHSENGKDYIVKVISVNEYRPPETKYACDVTLDGKYVCDDFYFCGEEFFDKCERIEEEA